MNHYSLALATTAAGCTDRWAHCADEADAKCPLSKGAWSDEDSWWVHHCSRTCRLCGHDREHTDQTTAWIATVPCRDTANCSLFAGSNDEALCWSPTDHDACARMVTQCPATLHACSSSTAKVLRPLSGGPPPDDASKQPFYLHFHKAGGTSFCDAVVPVLGMAKHMKRFAADNCVSWFYRETRSSAADGCAFWKAWVLRVRPRLVALEPGYQAGPWGFEPQRDFCPDVFRYATTMRHPISRLYSHMCQHNVDVNYVMRRYQRPTQILNCSTSGGGPACIDDVGARCFGPIQHCGATAFDNFYVRVLTGNIEGSRVAPFATLNSSHLMRAASILASFDALLISELGYDSVGARAQLNRLGQDFARIRIGRSRKHATSIHQASQTEVCDAVPSLSQLRMMVQRNALDLALYKFAKGLSLSRVRGASRSDAVTQVS